MFSLNRNRDAEFLSRGLPDSKSLSLERPRESNQREGRPYDGATML